MTNKEALSTACQTGSFVFTCCILKSVYRKLSGTIWFLGSFPFRGPGKGKEPGNGAGSGIELLVPALLRLIT